MKANTATFVAVFAFSPEQAVSQRQSEETTAAIGLGLLAPNQKKKTFNFNPTRVPNLSLCS